MFYLVAGLSLLPLVGILLVAKSSESTSEPVDKRIDWLGGLMFTSGSVLLFFCLSQAFSAPNGWATPCKISCDDCHRPPLQRKLTP